MNIGIDLSTASAEYKLETAILLYTHTEQRGMHARTVAVQHDVIADKSGARLGTGTFVTTDFHRKLLDMCDRLPLTFLPERVLAASQHAIAWFEPASERTMYFAPHSDSAVRKFDEKKIAQPALLFIARESSLSVFALASDSRPQASDPIYLAPYWNVYDNNTVCLGSMRIPKSINIDATTEWTGAFFASNFTHQSGSRKRFARSGTYAELLGAVSKEGRFLPEWLVSIDKTVLDVIRGA